MKFHHLPRLTGVALGLALAASGAQATNGYFAHGYGIKAKGMGGAAVAMTHDAFAGANNPAAAAFAGNRWDLGVDVFSPKRSATRVNADPMSGSAESENEYFLVPEFGYNVAYSDAIGLNLTVYGNGGMNTEYPGTTLGGVSNILGGSGKLGVDLMQLIVAPTIAYKLTDRAAVGISPLFVYQRFEAYGLSAFSVTAEQEALANDPRVRQRSLSPDSVTGKGSDSSTGFGVRLGYLNRISDELTIGASYSPKVNMGRFKKYAGLFAEGGDFDIPANYAVGAAFQATPTVQIALDYQRIEYSGVASVANPSTNNAFLGSAQGPGFGWQDINVVKLGVQWAMSPTVTLRAGYNRGDNPIQSRDVTFNILAPGVMEQHFTLGATFALAKNEEISGFYMRAPSNSVSGNSMFGGTETIKMSQNSLGLQYSKKF